MMNRNEFFDYVKEHVKNYLPPVFDDAEFIIQEVTKQNDQHLTGLSIRREGEQMIPTIYLDSYYKQYLEGADPDELVGDVADARIEYNVDEIPKEFSEIMDYETAKGKLQIVLCDPEMNQDRLKGKISKPFGEYTATYQVSVLREGETYGTVAVTEGLLKYWNVTPEQLHADAIAAEDARIPSLYSINDLMMEMMMGGSKPNNLLQHPEEIGIGGVPLFCLTTEDKMFGASLMVRDDILSKAAEALGGNFYVLPSSTHEVLLMPESFADDPSMLVGMVREINENEVSPNERLSDKVQFYDSEAHVLENAEKRHERLEQEKAEAKEGRSESRDGRNSRRSIHDRLNANKETARANATAMPHRESTRSAEASL